MVVLNLIWQLIARLFLGALVFCVIVFFGFLYAKSFDENSYQISGCTYQNSAELQIGAHNLNIPAIKGTTLWYQHVFGGPDRIEYAKPIFDKQWDKTSLGFCDTAVANRPNPDVIVLKKLAIGGIAKALELPSHQTIDKLAFGTTGSGGWLTFNPMDAEPANPAHMILRKPVQEPLNWQFTQSAGWIDGAFRISAWCAPMFEKTTHSCNVGIKRKSDGLRFEVWGVVVKSQPAINRPAPRAFLELAAKIPKILDLFAAE